MRALTDAAARRTARRRAGVWTALAGVVAIAGVGGAVVVLGSDSPTPRVAVAAGYGATNTGAGVSVELPDGWSQLTTVEGTTPPEILVVGNSPRPDEALIQACMDPPPPGSAYVTLYEYMPGTELVSPDREFTYRPELFVPRTADFATTNPTGGSCASDPAEPTPETDTTPGPVEPGTTVPPTVPSASEGSGTIQWSDATDEPDYTVPESSPEILPNHFRQFAFTDAGRMFVARVVTSGDPSQELLDEAVRVLNTLRVQPLEGVSTTTVPLVTTTSAPAGPADVDTAVRDIQDAMTAAYGGASPVPIDESVVGGFPFDLAERATTATTPGAEPGVAGKIVVRINWIQFTSPATATVNFDLLVDGSQITVTTTGTAAVDGGRWRMGREAFCEIIARSPGIACPS